MMCKKRKEIWEYCPPFLIVSKDEVLVEVFLYVLCSSTAGNIDKSINRRRIFWSKSPIVGVLRTTYIIISFIPQISCKNAIYLLLLVVSRCGEDTFISLYSKRRKPLGDVIPPLRRRRSLAFFSNKVAILWEILSCF